MKGRRKRVKGRSGDRGEKEINMGGHDGFVLAIGVEERKGVCRARLGYQWLLQIRVVVRI
jgi:hypothetical protein